ncbi:MAG: bifunctional phosphoribosylaminoimidazolecarboxamide formyltransferase/IMP cyclohydrolase [Pleurocapsa sp. MO_226.B13]|nr:bifunctional phosphoribosylaminoimidazolecarboxamide formyltransferase/IMP cyclohydrolase [Pleurocapsa sp. MO_226.B13]
MSRLALLSVSDKTGIVEFARKLVEKFQFEIISSGGTAKTLQDAGITVTKVSDYTGSPEILGGRVKTLHPRIHGGILARQDLATDREDLAANDIRPFDLVVVNLYPFEQTIAQPNVTISEAIEKIDIGGPTLIRAAAKNFKYLTVLCNPSQYDNYLAEYEQSNQVSLEFRQRMAGEAFAHTNSYDRAISAYFANLNQSEDLGDSYSVAGHKIQSLRYGENPHQPAAWYQTGKVPSGWASATKLQGKELSYNNLVDLEAARRIISEFDPSEPAAAVLKHTNPCGAAVGNTLCQAYEKAFNADNISAFGGIVALNQPIDAETAQALTKTFLECVVAPGCDESAREILQAKSKLRVLLLSDLATGQPETIKAIAGGFLVQKSDEKIENPDEWQFVTEKQPTPEQIAEMLFAQKLVKHVKSNAILVSRDRTTLGIGAGQMNRVGAVKIALEQAGDKALGGVLASDGFFPFDDSVRTAAAAGISAIIQPGGSIRDKDSIAAANELGIVMVLSGTRHFLH